MDERENEGTNRRRNACCPEGSGLGRDQGQGAAAAREEESRRDVRDVSRRMFGFAGTRETPQLLPASWERRGGGDGEVTLIKLAERGNGVRPTGSYVTSGVRSGAAVCLSNLLGLWSQYRV
ncbi:unnamed protein product [Lota lota]